MSAAQARPAGRRKSSGEPTLSVAEKIRRLEESGQSDDQAVPPTSSTKGVSKTKNKGEKSKASDPFWSLSGPSPLTSKTTKGVKKKSKLKSGGKAKSDDVGEEASMGELSSLGSTEKMSTRKYKKIKRAKSGNASSNLDNSTETFSSADSTLTSNTESDRQNRTTRKKKKAQNTNAKKKKQDDGCAPAKPATRKPSIDSKDGTKKKDASPKAKKSPQPSSANSSPKESKMSRALSSPNLTTPTSSIKQKISSMAQFSPWKKVDVSPTGKGSPKQSDATTKLPEAPISPGAKTSPRPSDTTSMESNKKLSPWKEVDVSPVESSTSSPPRKPARGLSPLPQPPLSLQKMDTHKDGNMTTKNQTPKKTKSQSIVPKTRVSQRTALPPPPQRGLARALSSPILTSPMKKTKTKKPDLATASKASVAPKNKPSIYPRRKIDRTISSPLLTSPTKKKKKNVTKHGNVERSSDSQAAKHIPLSRRNMLQSANSKRFVKRSSSSDDILDQMRGSLHNDKTSQPTRKVSLRPQSGRQLDRDLSAGNIMQPRDGRGRSVPPSRGVQRYSSAPTSSSNLGSMKKNGRGILRSISEDSAEDPSSSPLAKKGPPFQASRRAAYSRTHSVPVMGTTDGAYGSEKKLGNFKRPPPRRKRINRTRSDDVSSLAKSLHEPIEPQRRNSFDEPLRSALKPHGILRKSSSHEPEILSSHLSVSRRSSKSNSDQNGGNDVGFASSADVYYTSSDDEEDFSVEEETIQFEPLKTPANSSRPGMTRATSGSNLNLSIHSFMTTRSMLSVDKEYFDDDSKWKQMLRWLRLLPPHKDEKPLKKKIRVFTWLVLLFDFIAAMVAVTTYDGATTCCGEPIFSMLINLNWDVFFRVITYLYLILIFAEIVPVVRQGLPFNILNPTLGFAITFAMFFDDSVAEAVAMWIIEATAIFFEFLIYRIKARLFREEMERLAKTDSDLAELNKSRRESKRWLRQNSSHGGSLHGSLHSMPFSTIEEGHGSDDDSMSGNSFGGNDSSGDLSEWVGELKGASDEEKGQISRKLPPSLSRQVSTAKMQSPRTAKTADMLGASGHSLASMGSRVPLPGERKEMRLLRERRILRQRQQSEARELKIHFIGTCINIGLIIISLILIITIASTGGLCVFNERVKIFSSDQLKNCNQCVGATDVCEVCNADGSHQCYYPYY